MEQYIDIDGKHLSHDAVRAKVAALEAEVWQAEFESGLWHAECVYAEMVNELSEAEVSGVTEALRDALPCRWDSCILHEEGGGGCSVHWAVLVTCDKREARGRRVVGMSEDELTPKRPHAYGWLVCLDCHAIHMAVWPVVGRPVLHECPECGHLACIPMGHADGLSHEEVGYER